MGRNFGCLHAEQNDAPAAIACKRSRVLQRRTRVRRKVSGEKNVSERRQKISDCEMRNSNCYSLRKKSAIRNPKFEIFRSLSFRRCDRVVPESLSESEFHRAFALPTTTQARPALARVERDLRLLLDRPRGVALRLIR